MARSTVVDLDAMFDSILEQVCALGALSGDDLKRYKRHLPVLAERLRGAGLEVGRTARIPLEAQIVERIRAGFTPLRGLEKKVQGATAAEVKTSVQALLERGVLIAVVRESGVGFLHADTPGALATSNVSELLRQLGKAQKLLRQALSKRKAKGYGRTTVLDSDLPFRAPAELREIAAPITDAEVDRVGQAVRARLSHLPLRAPDTMRELAVSAELARRALTEGAARGWFTLQPESGMGRLSDDDARYCPEGPHGTRLSWIVGRRTS